MRTNIAAALFGPLHGVVYVFIANTPNKTPDEILKLLKLDNYITLNCILQNLISSGLVTKTDLNEYSVCDVSDKISKLPSKYKQMLKSSSEILC